AGATAAIILSVRTLKSEWDTNINGMKTMLQGFVEGVQSAALSVANGVKTILDPFGVNRKIIGGMRGFLGGVELTQEAKYELVNLKRTYADTWDYLKDLFRTGAPVLAEQAKKDTESIFGGIEDSVKEQF